MEGDFDQGTQLQNRGSCSALEERKRERKRETQRERERERDAEREREREREMVFRVLLQECFKSGRQSWTSRPAWGRGGQIYAHVLNSLKKSLQSLHDKRLAGKNSAQYRCTYPAKLYIGKLDRYRYISTNNNDSALLHTSYVYDHVLLFIFNSLALEPRGIVGVASIGKESFGVFMALLFALNDSVPRVLLFNRLQCSLS